MAIHHPSIIQSTGTGNQQPSATQPTQSSQQYQETESLFNQQAPKAQPHFEQQMQKPQSFGHHGQMQDLFESPDQLPELSQPMSKEHEEVIQDLLDSIPHDGNPINVSIKENFSLQRVCFTFRFYHAFAWG
jgi:hypothetical protein